MLLRTRFLLIAVLVAIAVPSHASIVSMNIAAGGWRTTNDATDGKKWLDGGLPTQGKPAVGYYTAPGTGMLAPQDMTWYCANELNACNNSNDNMNANSVAYFAIGMALDSPNNSGSIRMIADDYMELWVNGKFVFDALLADNKDLHNDPFPLELRVEGLGLDVIGATLFRSIDLSNVLKVGNNVFAIKAMDGYIDQTCGDATAFITGDDGNPSGRPFCPSWRSYRYLYVHTPEPATLSVFGLAALLLLRRRNRR